MSAYQFIPSPDLATKEVAFATWQNGFSEDEIAEIHKLGSSIDHENGTVTDGNVVNREIRRTKIAWISYNDKTAWLYDRLAMVSRNVNGQFFEFDLYGFVDDFQYTIYNSDEKAHYDWHTDKGASNASPRKLSLVLQLSDPSEYEGGDLEFLLSGSQPTKAQRQKGLIYVFPSWLPHRVTPVTSGVRKSLVAWITGPKFK